MRCISQTSYKPDEIQAEPCITAQTAEETHLGGGGLPRISAIETLSSSAKSLWTAFVMTRSKSASVGRSSGI